MRCVSAPRFEGFGVSGVGFRVPGVGFGVNPGHQKSQKP